MPDAQRNTCPSTSVQPGQSMTRSSRPASRAAAASTGLNTDPTATAETLRQLLAGVVAGEGATGRQAAPLWGSAAGKTGTAQTGQFTPDGQEKMNLWFAGFCPADDPRYTVVVLQDGQVDPAVSSAAVFAQVCEALWLLEG